MRLPPRTRVTTLHAGLDQMIQSSESLCLSVCLSLSLSLSLILPEVREFITRHTAYNKHDTGWAKSAPSEDHTTPPSSLLLGWHPTVSTR